MEDNKEFEELSKIGLGPLYARTNVIKYKFVYKYCMTLLSKVDNWEHHYERTYYWFEAPMWKRWKLSEIDKQVYFWKTIADAVKKRPRVFFKEFPEEYHEYNEENFKKLHTWIWGKTHKTVFIEDNYYGDSSYNDDPESAIMGALSHGYGDEIGYD